MDKRLKSTKLFDKGHEAALKIEGEGATPNECLLYGIAVMLDEALNGSKRAKARAKKEEDPLPFTGPDLHKRFAAELPEAFFYQPIDNGWWANLNKQIRDMNLKEENLDMLVEFFQTGRGKHFKQMPFSVMLKQFKRWVVEAAAGPASTVEASGFSFVRPEKVEERE